MVCGGSKRARSRTSLGRRCLQHGTRKQSAPHDRPCEHNQTRLGAAVAGRVQQSYRPSECDSGDQIVLTSLEGVRQATTTTGTDIFDILDWLRDGESILYTRVSSETGTDIWAWNRDRKAFP